MKYIIVLCFFISSGFAQKWANLKTTFGNPREPSPVNFHAMPLTRDEAVKQGFKPSSGEGLDCNVYLGQAYGQPEEPSITLLFDLNGNLAGSQSILLKSALKDNPDLAPSHFAYQEGSFFGEPCWTLTAYFMDPALICTLPGRAADGTAGDRLLIETGNGDDYLNVPLTREDADSFLIGALGWKVHYCVPAMGMHIMEWNYKKDQDCKKVFPIQILYDKKGHLNGFVWQNFGNFPGARWEHPDAQAVGVIIKDMPDCIIKLTMDPNAGLSTMHHYFNPVPQLTQCHFQEMHPALQHQLG